MTFRFALVPHLLGGPDDPGEHDVLAGFRLHGALEVRELAVRHVVAPAFHDPERAVLHEHGRGLGGQFAVGHPSCPRAPE
jgi:hypothetical protein